MNFDLLPTFEPDPGTPLVYLDNAATAPMLPQVIDAMCECMQRGLGNASSGHTLGRQARELLEESRAKVAAALRVKPEEIFFTSGGTEGNNLAIRGTVHERNATWEKRCGIVASALEHPSITKAVRDLKRRGWPAHYIRAPRGQLDFAQMESVLEGPDSANPTGIITCMAVQNELGFRFNLAEVVRRRNELAPQALVHTDAVQAFGKEPFAPHALGVDLATIGAHKIGGPQGVGALFVKEGTKLFSTNLGGGQERGLRSGTEPLPLIVGMATAAELAHQNMSANIVHVAHLKQKLEEGLTSIIPDVVFNSLSSGSPYIVNFSVPGIDNVAALERLSARGICLSKASACENLYPHVRPEEWRAKHPTIIQLAGVHRDLVESTFRVSFSAQSTEDDVRALVGAFIEFLIA